MTCERCGGHAFFELAIEHRHGTRTVYECDDCGHEQVK